MLGEDGVESRGGVKKPNDAPAFFEFIWADFFRPQIKIDDKTLKVLSTAHARWQFRTPHAPANCLDTQAAHAGHRFLEIDDGGELGLA
jgi:hypothetical protein